MGVRSASSSWPLLLAGIASACGEPVETHRWREEVLLHDRRIVVVEREINVDKHGFPDLQGHQRDTALMYSPLEVRWHFRFTPRQTQFPLSFDIVEGVPYLAVTLEDHHFCDDKPAGTPKAVFLKWTGDGWTTIPAFPLPLDRAPLNLLRGHLAADRAHDPQGLLTWHRKARLDSFNPSAPLTLGWYFRNIDPPCKGVRR